MRQKCNFCEKSFVQRSNLVRHERIHLNEKPYSCSFCEKTFSDKGKFHSHTLNFFVAIIIESLNLKGACTSHEKVHTKSESSFCTVCGKHFARKQKLKYHMRLHSLENVLRCECGRRTFSNYFKLLKESCSNRKDIYRKLFIPKGEESM